MMEAGAAAKCPVPGNAALPLQCLGIAPPLLAPLVGAFLRPFCD